MSNAKEAKEELLNLIKRLDKEESGNAHKKAFKFTIGSSAFGVNGTVSGYFAKYDRIADSYGDVCKRGFLNESIKKREASGCPFPLCYNHDLNQIIGVVESIEDRPEGAFMTAKFFDTPRAQEVRELVKSKCVHQMSFAYRIRSSGTVTLPDGTKANELRVCDLYEVSIVPIPAQPLSVITDIKSEKELARERSRKKSELLDFISNIKKDVAEEDKAKLLKLTSTF